MNVFEGNCAVGKGCVFGRVRVGSFWLGILRLVGWWLFGFIILIFFGFRSFCFCLGVVFVFISIKVIFFMRG